MIEAYPLHWPQGYPVTKYKLRSRFRGGSFAASRDGLAGEIKRLGGTQLIISTNIPLKKDGMPYGTYTQPTESGVAVYFMYKGNQVSLACDKWNYVADNMKALQKTVEAMRGLDRWGASQIMDRLFIGFKALPGGEASTGEPMAIPTCWDILGLTHPEMMNGYEREAIEKVIKSAFRTKAKDCHPDFHDNSPKKTEEFRKLQDAYHEALRKFDLI